MYSQDGKAMDVYPAVIQTAFRHMNIPVSVQAKPWRRALVETEKGLTGVGGVYKNSQREKIFDFSEPIFVERLLVCYHRNYPVIFTKVTDLKGKKVGVLRGWSYGDDFDNLRKANRLQAEEVNSDEQNFRKLAAHRLDVLLVVRESGLALFPKYPDITLAPVPLSNSHTFLAFSKASHRKELLDRFNQTLREMKKTGELQKLIEAELSR
jgi:polar amino acid transport system substrate-binding protein